MPSVRWEILTSRLLLGFSFPLERRATGRIMVHTPHPISSVAEPVAQGLSEDGERVILRRIAQELTG